MTLRMKLLAGSAIVGAVLWLPIASVALCAALGTLLHTDPWILPAAGFFYWRDFGGTPSVARWLPVCAAGAAVLVAIPAFLTLVWPGTRRLRPARPGERAPAPVRAASDTHGRADWLPVAALRGLFPGPHPTYGGVVIGEAYRVDLDSVAHRRFDPLDPTSWGQGGKAPLLIDPGTSDSGHGTVVAGSGGYKTTSVTLPTLATWTASTVVFDPPGQVAPMVTALREGMGHRVWTIRPGGDAIDVLGWIDPSDPLAETDVLSVISWLCGDLDSAAKGDNAVFDAGGRKLLACLLADMLWDPALPRAQKTLRELRLRVTTPEKKMKGRLQDIADASHSAMARDYARTIVDLYTETFSGVYFQATTETDFLAIDSYAEMLSRPDFPASAIVNGRTTAFISVPMKDLEASPALGRVLVGTFQAALRRAQGRVVGERVLFLLDEARFLRRLSILADMMTADRKYGATVVTMWQSQSDLEAIWKEQAGIFSANSSWTMYAAIEDEKTEKAISTRAGKFTVLTRTEGQSSGSQGGMSSSSRSRGTNRSTSEQPRDLIKPDEVRQMRQDEAIVFRRGTAPIRIGRAIYFRRPDLKARIGADRLREAAE